VIWGSGIAFIYPGLVALALELAGPARGPAMGTFTAFADLGAGIGAMIMGIVLTVTNYQIMFLCLSLVSLFNFSYFNFFLRKRREPR
jgi:predicted MFS family arabinose efflux permease